MAKRSLITWIILSTLIAATLAIPVPELTTPDPEEEYLYVDIPDPSSKSVPQIVVKTSDEFSDRKDELTVQDGIVRYKGSYEWRDSKDRKYIVTYVADENGFRAHVEFVPEVQFAILSFSTPAKPQNVDGIGCALRNSLCG